MTSEYCRRLVSAERVKECEPARRRCDRARPAPFVLPLECPIISHSRLDAIIPLYVSQARPTSLSMGCKISHLSINKSTRCYAREEFLLRTLTATGRLPA